MRKPFVRNIRSIVIKVGTSVLTTKGRFDRAIVSALAAEISGLIKKGCRVYLVSSGAIGAGMTALKLKNRPKAMEGLQAAAAVGQRALMQYYEEAFSRHGLSTAQVLLTWEDLAQKARFMNAKRTLKQIQQWGCVPVINENDTVATDEIRFGDNDKLSSLLAILVEADVQVILSDTNGLFTRPGDGNGPERIQIVRRMGDSVFAHVRDSKTSFTVGGMRSKLNAVRMSVGAGIPVFLADGRDRRVLNRVFKGEDIGTLFIPESSKRRGKHNWINHYLGQVEKRPRG